MASHGHLREFDLIHSDWKSYMKHAKQYFTTNNVTDNTKQRAILLSACGVATYRLLKDILHPQLSSGKYFVQDNCWQNDKAPASNPVWDCSMMPLPIPMPFTRWIGEHIHHVAKAPHWTLQRRCCMTVWCVALKMVSVNNTYWWRRRPLSPQAIYYNRSKPPRQRLAVDHQAATGAVCLHTLKLTQETVSSQG